MKIAIVLVFILGIFGSCQSMRPVSKERHVLDIPQKIEQKNYYPESSRINYYLTQSILFAELGSRFYVRDELETAKRYFNLSITYDEHNSKSLFALGLLAYREGKVDEALKYFKMIKPGFVQAPYDIDYYLAAKMLLEQFPIKASVISLTRNDRSDIRENIIVINKGKNQGVLPRMRFKVCRIGNPIRDFNSFRVIGLQKTQVAEVSVLELEDEHTVCKVDKVETGCFIQINDSVESIIE